MTSQPSAGRVRKKAKVKTAVTAKAKATATTTRATTTPTSKSKSKSNSKSKSKSKTRLEAPKLLSGGNPQISKADGHAPVKAYIDALPGWKRDLGRRLDAFITRHVPHVQKAVKWNSPLYGIEGQGWFLGLHTFTHYLKLAFFCGTSLRPMPPGASKGKDTRYLDLREADPLDEAQLAQWLKQAAALPGWVPNKP